MSDVAIPRSRYQTLLRELKRGVDACGEIAQLRFKLGALVARLSGEDAEDVKRTIKTCDEVSRLRVELTALDRYLRELDPESTPLRPPSRTDIQSAFESSVEFAQGKKKP